MIVFTSVTTVKSKKKKIYILFQYFWKEHFDTFDNDVMFSGQRFSQCFVERLCDLLYEEVAYFFFVWRGCVTFCLKRFFSNKMFPGKTVFWWKKKVV